MHFYNFHAGDYIRDTAHLSDREDLLYRRMLDLYYLSEAALPADIDVLCRRIRAREAGDGALVAGILAEFFEQGPDGWHQGRCDAEIAKYAGLKDAGRRGAERRWGKGGKGSGSAEGSEGAGEKDPNGVAIAPPLAGQKGGQCDPNANQEPRTKNQEPKKTPPTPPAGWEAWWAAYPRKVAKSEAAKAFARLAPDEAVLARMMSALRVQAASSGWTRDDGQYIPHPTTYLNQRRWEDVPGISAVPAGDQWWKACGFENRWFAENAGCFPGTAKYFAEGKIRPEWERVGNQFYRREVA